MSAAVWARQREGGARLPLQLLLWLLLRLGPPLAGLVLPPLVAWYLLTATSARAASRAYLGRVLGRPARLRDVARHFHCFAATVLDRIFLLAGGIAAFDIRVEGLEHLTSVLAGGRGCVLLGAHLGSFEVLRGIACESPVRVRPMMYRRNAGALTALLDRLAPGLCDSVIEIGEPSSMLRAREAVAQGEIVGLLADRSPVADKMVMVPFLGSLAAFPAGPFALAASMAAPVVLFHGLRIGPRRYLVQFQPFADRLTLERANRAEDKRRWIARYAAMLEVACRAHPFNWFNFFPFWEHGHNVPPDQLQPGPPQPGPPQPGPAAGGADAAQDRAGPTCPA
jgi:predicted LPLAT superfamily acyltransferase